MMRKMITSLVLIFFLSTNLFAGMCVSNSSIEYPNYIKFRLYKALQQVNVFIVNETHGYGGSGVTIKYNEKYYILSAYHVIDEETDKISLYENGMKVCDLRIVKGEEINDLILFEPIDEDIVSRYYVELATIEPLTAEDVIVVGNPDANEDVVEDGRVMSYEYEYMQIRSGLFFGNSGGGVYNYQGYLVGIVSSLRNTNRFGVNYTVFNIIRLSVIYGFMLDLNKEKESYNWE